MFKELLGAQVNKEAISPQLVGGIFFAGLYIIGRKRRVQYLYAMSSLTVTLIQSNLFWEDKAANLSMLEDKIKSIGQPAELVVLPEMFSTGFSMRPKQLAETMQGDTIAWMTRVAAEQKVLLAGSVIIEEGGSYYNRLVWMLPNGQYGYYDKRHRFAYAGEDAHYTAGNRRVVAQVNGWRVNLQVCYDLRFPVWARQQVQDGQPEYDLLLYVANWPQRRSHAWQTLLQARAIENQCYVVGVNRVGNDGNGVYHSGNSMVVDPLGQTLYHREDKEDVFTTVLQKQALEEVRNQFPFWKDGDAFALL
jgi:omega-amidase